MKTTLHFLTLLLVSIGAPYASNLANPAVTLPEARISIGASYYLGGYSLTNLEVPSLFNRIHGRLDYGPFKYVTLGIDLGATQIEVDKFAIDEDTIPVFHGKYGFSGGAHLKVATPPFLKRRLALIAIGQATIFNSENQNIKTGYNGKDGTGIIGIQLHVPGFGYISAGPWVYLIQGESKSYDGTTSFFSNTDNIRGWLSIDYFPKITTLSTNKPYFSFEFSISPNASASKRLPFQEISASISIGSITKRLYGSESDIEWNP
jgi:hypothetical protein